MPNGVELNHVRVQPIGRVACLLPPITNIYRHSYLSESDRDGLQVKIRGFDNVGNKRMEARGSFRRKEGKGKGKKEKGKKKERKKQGTIMKIVNK